MLLDLESHPPPVAIDRVQVRVEPTPGRVLQWTLFDRAQPAPEQVATLMARLTALMGEGRVGSPVLVDAWRPGAFAMTRFAPPADVSTPTASTLDALPLAFRRFRLPIPVRVRVDDGRPARVTTDRRGITGGVIVQASGPWRTSGEWWARADSNAPDRESGRGSRESEARLPGPRRGGDREGPREGGNRDRDRTVATVSPESCDGAQSRDGFFPSRSASELSRPASDSSREDLMDSRQSFPDSRLPTADSRSRSSPWDRDEWDIAMADGTVYRLCVEREVGQWFLEGVFD